MKFDYDLMEADLIRYFGLDTGKRTITTGKGVFGEKKRTEELTETQIERGKIAVARIILRHKAVLRGFRLSSVNVDKEADKLEALLDEMNEVLTKLSYTHPAIQRMVSETMMDETEFGVSFPELIADFKRISWAHQAIRDIRLRQHPEFRRFDVPKMAAIDGAVSAFRWIEYYHLPYQSKDFPKEINEASELGKALHALVPMFQVDTKNIRGAYANWHLMLRMEEEVTIMRLMEKSERKEYDDPIFSTYDEDYE